MLAQTGVAGRPEEYFEALQHSGTPRRPHEYFDPDFHPDILARLAFREMLNRPASPSVLWSGDTYDRYMDSVLDAGTTPNGVFGAKLMWGYLPDFAALLRTIDGNAGAPVPALLDASFPGLRYIRITRTDKVRQAVSLWKAVQTQAWRAERAVDEDRELEPPAYSYRAIDHLVMQLHQHDASWTGYFTGLGVEPVEITYEELAEAHEPVVRRVLDHLGIPYPEPLDLGEPRLKVQADAISEDWVERYRTGYRSNPAHSLR